MRQIANRFKFKRSKKRSQTILVGMSLCSILAGSVHVIPACANELAEKSRPSVSYVDASGAIQVVGNDGMDKMLVGLNALFSKTHPEIHIKLYLHGSSTAMPALTSGISAFAPMGRDIWPSDRANFKNTHGYEPVDIKIGYAGWGPRASFKTPPSVYVNQANPLSGLTLAQLRQILVSGNEQGDISEWSQLNHDATTVARRIHVYGTPDDGGFATAFRLRLLHGRPFTERYETLPNAHDVMQAIASDPYGIGFVGWFNPEKTPNVRLLPISSGPNEPYATPSPADLTSDLYPLASYLHLVVDKVPGQPIAPWLSDYLKLVLSPAGQALIGQERLDEGGFLPLSDALRNASLNQVESLSKP